MDEELRNKVAWLLIRLNAQRFIGAKIPEDIYELVEEIWEMTSEGKDERSR